MKITKLCYGGEFANVYVIGEEGKPCVIVDPATNKNDCLDNYIEKHHQGLCQGILITHGHFDHIGGLMTLKHLATVFMAEEDIPCLADRELNGSDSFDDIAPVVVEGIDPYPLTDEDEIKIGGYIFKVIATPFHTKGSVCFYVESEKVLFSGDTLFHLSIGRTDLPSGSNRTVGESLSKLAKLPKDVKVYPGHGEMTTMGTEYSNNPAFQSLKKFGR
jgi:hydroxyacylglutathione hydrolase